MAAMRSDSQSLLRRVAAVLGLRPHRMPGPMAQRMA